MSVEVLVRAFEKAKSEVGSDKKTHLATYLSDILQEDYNYTIGERRLRDYYTEYNRQNPKQYPDLKPKLTDCFCKYLGYENYASYVIQDIRDGAGNIATPYKESFSRAYRAPRRGGPSAPTVTPRGKVRYWYIALAAGIVGCIVYAVQMKTKKECMIWVIDHYEKSVCDGQRGETALVIPIFEKLKKTKVCDTTTFFKNGEPVIWYVKGENGYEYFTSYGLHPITGKTLRPICQKIIDQAVAPCPSIENTTPLKVGYLE